MFHLLRMLEVFWSASVVSTGKERLVVWRCNGGQFYAKNNQTVDCTFGASFGEKIEEHVSFDGSLVAKECVASFG